MKKFIKVIIFILIVALLVAGAIRLIKKRKAQEAQTPKAQEYAVIINTLKVKKSYAKLTLPYIAISKNDNNTLVASKVGGRILYIKKSGEIVKKGQTLVKIDDSSLKASLASIEHSIKSTKVALSNMELVHKRTKKLLSVGGATKEQFDAEKVKIDEIKAKLASLYSKKSSILDNLSYTTIKAPSDAIVSQALAHAGDLAMPGKPLLKLTTNSKSYLLIRVPQSIKSVIYKGKEYQAVSLDSTFNGLKEYRADINEHLSEGQRVDIDVVTFKGEGVKLPMDAILNRDGKNYVIVIDGKKAVPKEVKIVASGQEGVVVSGLSKGQKVAVAKPDILLRLVSGYPFVIKNKE